jgi:hypothetical protein
MPALPEARWWGFLGLALREGAMSNESFVPDEHQPFWSAAVPADFQRVAELCRPGLGRKLGYRGEQRFVLFYYEPRGDEVMWKDGRSYGFGQGGWCVFLQHIMPLADRYEVDLGSSTASGTHVLLVDRELELAYFVQRQRAEQFLMDQQ